jgi:predicted RNA binding protein YcfA (HicA-like mRNA interferase family)
MANVEKLYALLVAGRAGVLSFRDFEALLMAFGFVPVRQKGSHRSFKHPKAQRMMVIQPRGRDATDYQVRQFLDMFQEYGLKIDDR